MQENAGNTLERITQAAMAEFMEKGFLGASLRKIVQEAGVTTGAFYGYFPSKEALFSSLVKPHADRLMDRFMETQTTFAKLPGEEQAAHLGVDSYECVRWMVNYICDNPAPVKLLLTRAEGTQYQHFVHDMVEVEVDATMRYLNVQRGLGQAVPDMDPALYHIAASGMFSAIFEVVIHDMPREKALDYTERLLAFYTAGWMKWLEA